MFCFFSGSTPRQAQNSDGIERVRAKTLRAQRPRGRCALVQLCRKVFEASRLNLCERVDLTLFLGK